MKQYSIVTFNMRFPNEADGENYYLYRVPFIKEVVEKRRPDVIACQEVTDEFRLALVKALPDYTVVGAGRMPDRHGEGVAFLFRKDSLELSELRTEWLSDTPATPGSRYEGSDQSYVPRVMAVATFLPFEEGGQAFRVYNLHTDHVGKEARLLSSKALLASIEKDRAQNPLPFVALGDLNAFPTDPEITLLCESPLMRDVTGNLKITFHRFMEKGYEGMKIDYIFVSEEFSEETVTVWGETRGGLCLSDHHPIEAKLTL